MFPRGALFYLTNSCNMNCRHCGIVDNANPSYLSNENFEGALKLLKEKKCYIVAISGGDPILHPQCFDYIRKIRANGMLPVLGISGVGLNDVLMEKIKKANVGCVQVSLDGTNEVENSFFRDKGSFSEILANIKKMQKEGIKVNIAVCLVKENVHILDNMLVFLKNLNAYQIKIQFWEKTYRNTSFHELEKEEKREVFRKVQCFAKSNNLRNWANVDMDFADVDLEKKFILYPDGNVYDKECGHCVGAILKDCERIKNYYEK